MTTVAAAIAPSTSEPSKRAFISRSLPGARAVRRAGSSVFFIGAVFSFSGTRALVPERGEDAGGQVADLRSGRGCGEVEAGCEHHGRVPELQAGELDQQPRPQGHDQ